MQGFAMKQEWKMKTESRREEKGGERRSLKEKRVLESTSMWGEVVRHLLSATPLP